MITTMIITMLLWSWVLKELQIIPTVVRDHFSLSQTVMMSLIHIIGIYLGMNYDNRDADDDDMQQ